MLRSLASPHPPPPPPPPPTIVLSSEYENRRRTPCTKSVSLLHLINAASHLSRANAPISSPPATSCTSLPSPSCALGCAQDSDATRLLPRSARLLPVVHGPPHPHLSPHHQPAQRQWHAFHIIFYSVTSIYSSLCNHILIVFSISIMFIFTLHYHLFLHHICH